MQSLGQVPTPPPAPLLPSDAQVLRRTEAPQAKWQVRVGVQMVAIPETTALSLLPDIQSDDDKKVEAAVAIIQTMIKKKEAVLLAWPMIVGLEGERQVLETTVEKRFASNFEPPQVPTVLGEGAQREVQKIPLVPNSWDVRNTGVTLEVDALVLENGKLINLNLLPSRVTLLRIHSFDTGKTKDGIATQVDQPEFSQEKTTASITLRNGQSLLLSLHKLEQPAGYLEFVIVRAVATKIE